MTETDRRRFLAQTVAIAAAASVSVRAWGQTNPAWPTKPIRMVVGFPPGGLTDSYARFYGEHLRRRFGQPVVIENKPGAGSLLACELVAKAPPDGHTMLMTIQASINQNRVLYKNLPYDPDKDFSLIAAFDSGRLPLVVHANTGIQNFSQFVDYAKRNRIGFGSFAPGSYAHMTAAQINKLFGTQLEVVNYRGEGPMWQDFMAGGIQSAVGSYLGAKPVFDANIGRAIAVPGEDRVPAMANVPTYVEQGYRQPIFIMEGWVGLLGPAGMPPAIIQAYWDAIREASETPEIKRMMQNFAVYAPPVGPEEFTRRQNLNMPVWVAMAKELGVSLD